MTKNFTRQLCAVGVFLVPVVIGVIWRVQRTTDERQTELVRASAQLSVIPIRKITTTEVVLNRMGCWATSNEPDLAARAKDAGPWAVLAMLPVGKTLKLAKYALRVAAGGLAINDLIGAATIEDAILQEVTVSVAYAVDLNVISTDRIELRPRAIRIRLPPPKPLSEPEIDLDRSPTLDRQTSGDKQDAEWPRLKQLAFEDAQRHASQWVAEAGLDSAIREQSRDTIREFIVGMTGPDTNVQVVFDDEQDGGAQ